MSDSSKNKRTSVALDQRTMNLARRLCRAYEDHFDRLPPLSEIIQEGLLLLAKAYQRKKIKIPKKAAAMRPGPKKIKEN